MTKRVLIIHGWESNSREHWFLEEKKRLEGQGHEVVVPDMPNTLHPKKEEWVEVIRNFNPDEDSILIGHSLGGVAILRYLEVAGQKVGKCILIATPIRKLGQGYEGIENFLEGDFNWDRIKESVQAFIVFQQKNDPAVSIQHGKDLANNLGADLVMTEGNDHFDKIDFELLEKYISKISMNYKGVIIEESLENKDILREVVVLATKVEPVIEKHKTPWLKQWTLHTVEIAEDRADEIAEKISKSLDSKHGGSWYADFKNDKFHFIIFRNKVFKVDLGNPKYRDAMEYGVKLGIPWYQLDFSPEIEEWKR